MVRSAIGPTRASDGVRVPPVSTTEASLAPGSAACPLRSRLTTRTELVTMVTPGTPGMPISRSASANVVVPADRPMALPGVTSSAAAPAIAALAACSRVDLVSKPGSWLLGAPGRTAPPWTLSMSPARASTSRSRRIVISETPRRMVSSLTRALPAPRTSCRISACRCLASISSPFAGERCGRPPLLRPPLGGSHRVSGAGAGDCPADIHRLPQTYSRLTPMTCNRAADHMFVSAGVCSLTVKLVWPYVKASQRVSSRVSLGWSAFWGQVALPGDAYSGAAPDWLRCQFAYSMPNRGAGHAARWGDRCRCLVRPRSSSFTGARVRTRRRQGRTSLPPAPRRYELRRCSADHVWRLDERRRPEGRRGDRDPQHEGRPHPPEAAGRHRAGECDRGGVGVAGGVFVVEYGWCVGAAGGGGFPVDAGVEVHVCQSCDDEPVFCADAVWDGGCGGAGGAAQAVVDRLTELQRP